jgi:hypothetical protein
VPGQGARIGVELLAHHLRRGVRSIVPARRYPAAEDILRRLQPEAGEGKVQLPGDSLDGGALLRLGVNRISDYRPPGEQTCRLSSGL